MDFCLYCIYNSVIDHELYSRNGKTAAVYKMVYQLCSASRPISSK